MKANADKANIIEWLKAGRCPECMFTFLACTCGPTMRILLHIAAESVRQHASDWNAKDEAVYQIQVGGDKEEQ